MINIPIYCSLFWPLLVKFTQLSILEVLSSHLLALTTTTEILHKTIVWLQETWNIEHESHKLYFYCAFMSFLELGSSTFSFILLCSMENHTGWKDMKMTEFSLQVMYLSIFFCFECADMQQELWFFSLLWCTVWNSFWDGK